jgi:hypothetical protein
MTHASLVRKKIALCCFSNVFSWSVQEPIKRFFVKRERWQVGQESCLNNSYLSNVLRTSARNIRSHTLSVLPYLPLEYKTRSHVLMFLYFLSIYVYSLWAYGWQWKIGGWILVVRRNNNLFYSRQRENSARRLDLESNQTSIHWVQGEPSKTIGGRSWLLTRLHAGSESYVTTDGQSASLSWNNALIWGLRPDMY